MWAKKATGESSSSLLRQHIRHHHSSPDVPPRPQDMHTTTTTANGARSAGGTSFGRKQGGCNYVHHLIQGRKEQVDHRRALAEEIRTGSACSNLSLSSTTNTTAAHTDKPCTPSSSSGNMETKTQSSLQTSVPLQFSVLRNDSQASILLWNSNNNNRDQQPHEPRQSLHDNVTPVPKNDSSFWTKIGIRIVVSMAMFGVFCSSVYAGHLYVCLVVALVETLLFRELVTVRYSTYFHTIIKDTIPLFRTTQWLWFVMAMFYNYQDFICELVQNSPKLHRLLPYVQYASSISFALYSATLIITVTTLQREHLKFQINQLCWTIMVLCLTLGQLKYIMHNIINGLFWFVFPCCLVFCNDIMAFVCGMSMGRKFIARPFWSISPNKTWEGFLGAGVCTMVASWYTARYLAQYSWMTCPINEFHIVPPETLKCEPDPVFLPAQWIFPSQMFDIMPRSLIQAMPSVVEICRTMTVALETSTTTLAEDAVCLGADDSVNATTTTHGDFTHFSCTVAVPSAIWTEHLGPCISGSENQMHHHFEFRVTKDFFPIQVHALWLALFASFVAPFGGFLASAIKRAYGIKDFATFIPGHGGVMDRFDCQLLMALCTWVYYNTFIKIATVSVPKLAYLYSLLSPAEQNEFLALINLPKT